MAEKASLKIEQNAKYEDPDWWDWSVWVDGPEHELNRINFVEYTLHPTFREPVRIVSTSENKFSLSTSGWGTFPIYARIHKKDGSVVRLRHQLQLKYPNGRRVTA